MELFNEDSFRPSPGKELRKLEGDTRIVLVSTASSDLSGSDFGEGLSPRSATEFVQLTWREQKIYVISRDMNGSSFDFIDVATLDSQISEGWGVTADESTVDSSGYYQLYISDGSEYIYKVDGGSLSATGSIHVYDESTNSYIDNLNELEFVDGHIYANVWQTDQILKIDPDTGYVIKKWSMSTL